MRRLIPAALWMAVIFATSSTVVFRTAFVTSVGRTLPGPAARGLWAGLWMDHGLVVVKGYHAAEFALLFLLVRGALIRPLPHWACPAGIAVSVLFAASDEWHQTFVPGRGGTWTDVAIDAGGVLAAASLVSLTRRGRLGQAVLLISTVCLSWLGMQIVHEAGHALAAWAGGETVHRVVLHPLAISRTDATRERHPLLLAWGGPLVGSALPVLVWGLARRFRLRTEYLFRFFAGFCLVVNGAYLGAGGFEDVGDAGDLLRFGCPLWTLVAFGLATVPAGLWLWHGLGPYYGLGEARGHVRRGDAAVLLGVLLVVVLAEMRFGP